MRSRFRFFPCSDQSFFYKFSVGTARTVLVFLLALSFSAGAMLPFRAADDPPCSWYCVRAKNHEQPRADAALSYVERYGGVYVDHRHADPNADDKVVYLTFDAGYENGNVARILDALREEDATAAFFILGHLAVDHPDLVRRMADEGHLVCNHTYAHPDMSRKSEAAFREELHKLETACREAAGVEIQPFFRPPEGRFSHQMMHYAQNMGYTTVFWSFAYADWDNDKQPDPAAAQKKILDNLHNGAVILLHPTSATNAAILPSVLRALKAQGYRFGSLDELAASQTDPQTTPGVQPRTADSAVCPRTPAIGKPVMP